MLSQQESFNSEIETLRKNKQLSKGYKILNLNPFLDSQGILRVGGRIANANISEEQKHPAIIDKGH